MGAIESSIQGRIAVLSRCGDASMPAPATLLQEDDILHVVVAADQAALLDEALHLEEGSH